MLTHCQLHISEKLFGSLQFECSLSLSLSVCLSLSLSHTHTHTHTHTPWHRVWVSLLIFSFIYIMDRGNPWILLSSCWCCGHASLCYKHSKIKYHSLILMQTAQHIQLGTKQLFPLLLYPCLEDYWSCVSNSYSNFAPPSNDMLWLPKTRSNNRVIQQGLNMPLIAMQ